MQRFLRHLAHVMPIQINCALRHIVKTGNQLAECCFASSGGADKGNRLALCNLQRNVVQNSLSLLIRKGHMIHVDVTLHVLKRKRALAVLKLRLRPHQLHKSVEPRRTVCNHLRCVRKLPDGAHKGRDIQAEGNQVDDIQLALHNEGAAHCDHRHGQHAEEKFHRRIELRHGAVKAEFCPAIALIRLFELLQLLRLIGKGLRRPDSGKLRLKFRVDRGNRHLHLARCIPHVKPAEHHNRKKDRQHQRKNQGKSPLNPEHENQCAKDGHRRNKQVLRRVMRHLRHVKKICRQAAHQLPHAVVIEEAVIQFLDVPEQISPDVRLDPRPEVMPPVADNVIENRPQRIRDGHDQHDRPEGPPRVVRKQRVHAPARHPRKRKIDHRNQKRAHHVQVKQLPVRLEIGQKNLKL